MALDARFLQECAELNAPGMGTESVAPLLYALARMVRPHVALEVGLGYSTPFLALALAEAAAEHREDRRILAGELERPGRAGVLHPLAGRIDYRPRLYAIDDFTAEGSTAGKTLGVLERLGLKDYVVLHAGDFRGRSGELGLPGPVLDLLWFDAGGPAEYLDLLKEYWPLVNPLHGLVILHFTYWQVEVPRGPEGREAVMLPSPLLNELKRQQAEAGLGAQFEVLSLLEPHKTRQGSVTLLRKLPPGARARPFGFAEEMRRLTGKDWPEAPKL